MRRRFTLVFIAILLVGSVLLGLSDIDISVARTGILDDETITSQTEATNSSAGASITITWYTGDSE